MEEDYQQSITLKIFDNKLQKSCSLTVKVGDKYKDSNKFVWECTGIGYGHITFVQDVNIEYDYWVPSCDRRKPYCILSYEQAEWFLPCPIRNWVKTTEPTRTIEHPGRTFHMNG